MITTDWALQQIVLQVVFVPVGETHVAHREQCATGHSMDSTGRRRPRRTHVLLHSNVFSKLFAEFSVRTVCSNVKIIRATAYTTNHKVTATTAK